MAKKQNKRMNTKDSENENSPIDLSKVAQGITATLDTFNIISNIPTYKPLPDFSNLEILHFPFSEDRLKLSSDIGSLNEEINSLTKELKNAQNTKERQEELINQYNQKIIELENKQKISHVLSRISPEAQERILDPKNEFNRNFIDGTECNAVVVSIDIRRSTELMLKARTPKQFSNFITGLSNSLSEIIIKNLGIFDKFTGDGILAFFPKFYSGEQAILRAIKAAEECHILFNSHYNASKSTFQVFIKDVGLGIGIDYGQVTIVNSINELTVVGIPVVYACRFSGAKAGETLLNVGAKEEVEIQLENNVYFDDAEISIKNEGIASAYKIKISPTAFKHIKDPAWIIESKKNIKEDNI